MTPTATITPRIHQPMRRARGDLANAVTEAAVRATFCMAARNAANGGVDVKVSRDHGKMCCMAMAGGCA